MRSIALVRELADALAEHRNRSAFQADDELVFCNPQTGGTYMAETFKLAFDAASHGLAWSCRTGSGPNMTCG